MTESTQAKTQFQTLLIGLQTGEVSEQAFFPAFLHAEFYVAIEKHEGDSGFDYLTYDSKQNPGTNTLVISEDVKYLQGMGAKEILLIPGAQIVMSMYDETELSIVFEGGGLGMPVEMIQSLKGSLTPTAEAENTEH